MKKSFIKWLELMKIQKKIEKQNQHQTMLRQPMENELLRERKELLLNSQRFHFANLWQALQKIYYIMRAVKEEKSEGESV